MDLSIIIVSYNTKQLLKKCLQSIHALEIIVVDNSSTDGSPQMVKKEFPKVKLIKNKTNLGFAKAVNQGLRSAQSDYFLLLNSDIIVKSSAIKKMIDFAKQNPRGVVGGKLLNPDGTLQGSCFYLPTVWRAVKGLEKYAPKDDLPTEVEAVAGAVFLIPRKVITKVGLFDERYFMYFEDLDYCRRVRKAGFKVYYLPQAEFIHYHGASGKKISDKTRQWLRKSSKIYHGQLKYWLITFAIWIRQKWQKIC